MSDCYAQASLERKLQIARGQITWPEVAVICPVDDIRGAALAATLRRQGIITETYFSGNKKKQLQKAASSDADFALFVGDELELKDMIEGTQRTINSANEILPAIIESWAWRPVTTQP